MKANNVKRSLKCTAWTTTGSESAKLKCEQHEGRLVLFNACSFVAGGPEPQEGGGLGQAQTFMV